MMEIPKAELSKEELEIHGRATKYLCSHFGPMSLKCATELGIPAIIVGSDHGKPVTLSDLISKLPIHPTKSDHLRRLMHMLVHSGFFTVQRHDNGEEAYLPTAFLRYFVSDNGKRFILLDPLILTTLTHLSKWFQGDEPTPFHTVYGESMWDLMARHPGLQSQFNEDMARDTRLIMRLIVAECRGVFEGVNTLVDVGGGTGTSARTISDAFPHIRCTVLDQPHVVAVAPDDARVKYVGGDMFEHIPSADVIFLKWILHDWNDDECVKILKRCKEAIPSKEEGGKVILVEMVTGFDKGTEIEATWDVGMMLLGGKERQEFEWHKLFINAGFTDYKIIPILGMRSIIEVYP
ncbi:Trans-resveratrol di-O-methyltransferase [Acorus calamus]|uniref:Trans-resveratrol di-O-methyltransferase n=1 Tax=Acorus calamus TaxID=4465 RepID=A0AAV9C2V5_ACOCL|nr:Trans-resveratrol di-O-methyltransferase [Acorus calamus]